MLRRTPLRAKREKSRRNEGRVRHERMKPKAARQPNAKEARYHDMVAGLGCLICGCPATIHHVTSDGHKRIARSHQRVAPLCPMHHQKVYDPKNADPVSVEGLGHAAFAKRYGIDLLKWAGDAWSKAESPEDPFWTDGITLCRRIAAAKNREWEVVAGGRK